MNITRKKSSRILPKKSHFREAKIKTEDNVDTQLRRPVGALKDVADLR